MHKARNVLFLVSFGVYLFFTILQSSFFAINISPFYNIAIAFCILLLFIKELLVTKIKVREIIFFVAILLLSLIFFNNGGRQLTTLPLFLFIYSARNVDIEKILSLALIESSLLLFIIIICSKLGIIVDYVETGTRVRHYLGFRYPLFPQMLLFNITALDLFLHKKKITFLRAISLVAINTIVFLQTDAKLSFYLVLALIIGAYTITKYPKFFKKRKVIHLLMVWSFVLCSIIAILFTLNYNQLNPQQYEFNKFLGNRLSLGKSAIEQYGINMTGNDITFIGNGLSETGEKPVGIYNYVDSLYIMLLLRYGLIFFIVFIFILTATNFYLYKKKHLLLLFIMTVFALHGIIDDLIIYLYYNTFWLVIGKMIIGDTRKTKELADGGEKEVA